MTEDEIVREVRSARAAFAANHGNDIRAMVEALRKMDAADSRPVVRFAPRPVDQHREGPNPADGRGAARPPVAETARPFTVGRTYSRQEISAVLGGSVRHYLPVSGGRVVCGCFKPIPAKNPDAPEKVTFGKAGRPEPRRLAQQLDPIPVFLFRSPGAWEYCGRYRCTGLTTDLAMVQEEMHRNPARGAIAGVLHFARAGD